MAVAHTGSRKPRRYSYAERVVNAVSDIRKRTRKDSIHLKTLKVQVKKNAEDLEDQLGPHWETHLVKACKELTSRTFFNPTSAHGRVALTPDAKKRIAKTRQSFPLPNDHKHSPDCKEISGWRKLIRELPNSKSRRRSSARVQSLADEGEDASITKKKALSRMNKVELLAEVKRLQAALDETSSARDALESEISQDTDVLNLCKESQSKQLDELRGQDAVSLQDAEVDFGDITMVNDDDIEFALDEPRTPPASGFDDGVQLDNNDASKQSFLRPPTALGLTRTKTGSFISNISKQPTPAPSDSGSEPESPVQMDNVFYSEPDSFDPDATLVDCENDDGLGTQETLSSGKSRPGFQIHTPLSSPWPSLRKAGDGSLRIETELGLKKRIEELVEEREKLQKKLDTMGASLKERESTVMSSEAGHSSECKKLRESLASLRESNRALIKQHDATKKQTQMLADDNTRLHERNNQLESQLSEKTNELLGTQELLRRKEREAEEQLAIAVESAAKTKDAELVSGRARDESRSLALQLAHVEEELRGSDASRQALRENLDEALNETLAVRNELQDVIVLLEKEKVTVQGRELTLVQDVEATQAQLAVLQGDVQTSKDQVEFSRSVIQSALERLEQEHQAKLDLELRLEKSENVRAEYVEDADRQLRTLREEIGRITSELEKTKREVELARVSERSLRDSLGSSVARVEELTTRLELEEAELLQARKILGTKEADLVLSGNELEASRQQNVVLHASVEALQTQANSAEIQKRKLCEALEEAEERLGSIQDRYELMKKREMEQFEEMDRLMNRKRKRVRFDDPSQCTAPAQVPAHGTDIRMTATA